MGPILQSVVIALVPVGLVNAGALLYFAGKITRTVEDHGEAIKEQRDQCKACSRVVAVLAEREGIALS